VTDAPDVVYTVDVTYPALGEMTTTDQHDSETTGVVYRGSPRTVPCVAWYAVTTVVVVGTAPEVVQNVVVV